MHSVDDRGIDKSPSSYGRVSPSRNICFAGLNGPVEPQKNIPEVDEKRGTAECREKSLDDQIRGWAADSVPTLNKGAHVDHVPATAISQQLLLLRPQRPSCCRDLEPHAKAVVRGVRVGGWNASCRARRERVPHLWKCSSERNDRRRDVDEDEQGAVAKIIRSFCET